MADARPSAKRAERARAAEPEDEKGLAADGESIAAKRARGEKVHRKKFALLCGFNGKEYYGMQRQVGHATIEEMVLRALVKAQLIDKGSYATPQRAAFQRTARTDKGVSAARQIVSLKLEIDEPTEDTLTAINDALPDDIRVFKILRVTRGFHAKNACSGRRYEYMLPTYMLAPKSMRDVPETYRVPQEQLAIFQSVLDMYVGTHKFHNYTSQKSYNDSSASRYIVSFQSFPPYEVDGVEWMRVQVRGQSFVLHQIRKMIGMAVAVTRGHCDKEFVEMSFQNYRLDVPKAPGLGLLLDNVYFEHYNKKYGGTHEPLDWDDCDEAIEAFKAAHIHRAIVQTEKTEQEMRGWLATLLLHAYSELANKAKSEGDASTPTAAEGAASAQGTTNGAAEQQPPAAEAKSGPIDAGKAADASAGEAVANDESQKEEGEASATATASDMDVGADGDVQEMQNDTQEGTA